MPPSLNTHKLDLGLAVVGFVPLLVDFIGFGRGLVGGVHGSVVRSDRGRVGHDSVVYVFSGHF